MLVVKYCKYVVRKKQKNKKEQKKPQTNKQKPDILSSSLKINKRSEGLKVCKMLIEHFKDPKYRNFIIILFWKKKGTNDKTNAKMVDNQQNNLNIYKTRK